ncbi:MAG: hypothetical protein HGB29_01265 [Chlorobiaceae bacterium]|nr:hypothetical protein [Chlorobiaceae bacterium]NTW73476.1 hypothetical protein [Chlorobiaceae bacterium]
MNQSIDLSGDPKYAGVKAALDDIEIKLVENGKLVKLTGTVASSVTIEFGMYGDGKNAEPSILIKVTTPDDIFIDADEEILDDFEDFIIAELETASLEWSPEVKESLGDDRQIILLIDGEEY